MKPSKALIAELKQVNIPRPKPVRFVRMFKPRFASLVKSGAKRQTIRPIPKRIPHRGDILDLREWSGKPYRSPQRRLIEAEARDIKVVYIDKDDVFMQPPDGSLLRILGVKIISMIGEQADSFARADGFKDWKEMRDWFEKEHGLPFEGIAIYW